MRLLRAALVAHCAIVAVPQLLAQQLPLAPIRSSGQSVTPAFEGWYKNPDGTLSLSFGYLNRNAKEELDIPIGPNNFMSPGPADRGQPTHFEPRRHWGVFAVTVPADFGEQRLVWTLIVRGDTVRVPGSLKRNWEIDALQGEAGSGNTPPVLAFAATGPKGSGPGGILTTLSAQMAAPATLTVWATDDGRGRSSITSDGRKGVPVSLTWIVHQAPPGARVAFADATPAVDSTSGKSTTTVTFSVPGDYMLRVRANDASGIVSAGHAQCCWTNGFVKVTVRK